MKTANHIQSGQEDKLKKYGIYATVILAAFLIGLIPMWLNARSYENQRDQAVAALQPSVLQNTLATAVINARRGDYEQARQQTSDFFTDLRAALQNENNPFSEQQREALKPIIAERDETITMLARSDAASSDKLSDLYFAYLQAGNSAQVKKQ